MKKIKMGIDTTKVKIHIKINALLRFEYRPPLMNS